MDLQLTSLEADQTKPFTIRGVRANGHAKEVALVFRWAGASPEYQEAISNIQFRKLKDRDYREARLKLIAAHLVVGWVADTMPTGLAFTVDRAKQILLAVERSPDGSPLKNSRSDRFLSLIAFTEDGDNFQAEIVDPVDLGNE